MKKQLPLLIILFFTLLSCDNFLDCITNKRPQIHDATFRRGEVGIYYYSEVTTEIKNEPRDNDYDYFYELYGDLPEGIQMFVNYRTVSFEGIPEVPGSYTFGLGLYVDPPYSDDGFEETMCSDYTSKNFTIHID